MDISSDSDVCTNTSINTECCNVSLCHDNCLISSVYKWQLHWQRQLKWAMVASGKTTLLITPPTRLVSAQAVYVWVSNNKQSRMCDSSNAILKVPPPLPFFSFPLPPLLVPPASLVPLRASCSSLPPLLMRQSRGPTILQTWTTPGRSLSRGDLSWTCSEKYPPPHKMLFHFKKFVYLPCSLSWPSVTQKLTTCIVRF